MQRREYIVSAASLAAVGVSGCLNGDDDPDESRRPVDERRGGPDETIEMTGETEVSVDVAPSRQLQFAFDPMHIRIDTDTTVVWEWHDFGGAHNVVHDVNRPEREFDSGAAVRGDGITFEHTFDDEGTYEYVCTPHRAQQMFGSVEVV